MTENEHISSGSLARRCQARLTRTRPFLPAAAAARDKLGASTPEVGGGGGGQRGPGRTHLNSAGRRGPGSPGKLPERRRESKLHDPGLHNRSNRDPAPLRSARRRGAFLTLLSGGSASGREPATGGSAWLRGSPVHSVTTVLIQKITLIQRELIILNDRISNPNRLSAQGNEECCIQFIEHLINKADKMSLLKAHGETVWLYLLKHVRSPQSGGEAAGMSVVLHRSQETAQSTSALLSDCT